MGEKKKLKIAVLFDAVADQSVGSLVSTLRFAEKLSKNPVKTDGTKYGRPAGKPTVKREGVKYGRPPVKRTHGGIIPKQKYTMREGVKYGRPKGGTGIKITKPKKVKENSNPVGRPRGQKTIKKEGIIYGHPKGLKNKCKNIDGTTSEKISGGSEGTA